MVGCIDVVALTDVLLHQTDITRPGEDGEGVHTYVHT